MFKRGSFTTGRLFLALLAGLVLLATAAWAQEKVMTLGGEALKPTGRPQVKFNHEGHSKMLACFQCHHDYDKNWKNQYEEGMANKCADCHYVKPGPKDNPLPLAEAFHRQCKDCHRVLAKKGNPKVPMTCGECHVRGK